MLADLIKRLGKGAEAEDKNAQDDASTEKKGLSASASAENVKAAMSGAIAKAMEERRIAVEKKNSAESDNPEGVVEYKSQGEEERKQQISDAQESVRTFIERKFSAKSGHPAASIATLRKELDREKADSESFEDGVDVRTENTDAAVSSFENGSPDTLSVQNNDLKSENLETNSLADSVNADTDNVPKNESEVTDSSKSSDTAVKKKETVFSLNLGIGANGGSFGSISKKQVKKDAGATDEKETVRKSLSDSFVSDSAAVPMLVAVIMILMIVASFINISALEHRDNIFLSLIVIEVLVYIIPGIFYCKLKNIDYFSVLSLRPVGPDKIYFTVLCSATAIAVSVLGKTVLMSSGLYESEFALYASYIKLARSTTVTETIYVVITFAVIPALCRSFLFGGISVGTYHKNYGNLASCVVTALLYALLHLDVVQLPYHFAVGVIISFGVLMTRSIVFSVIVCVAEGIFSLFFDEYILGLVNSDYKILFVFIVVSVILALFTMVFSEGERMCYNRGIKGEANDVMTNKKTKEIFAEIFLSPTLILCVCMFFAYTIAAKI